MSELILHTFDWVPEMPRGYVRDLRVRWALEEAGLSYRVQGESMRQREAAHYLHQPFGQVPWLSDGELSIFESGAILLYLAQRSAALMPADAKDRAEVTQWVFAALNSVEMASLPWSIFVFSGFSRDTDEWRALDGFLQSRLFFLEQVLAGRQWLAGSFSVADILMADVLRLPQRFERLGEFPACRDYLSRATARPAFIKAHADQLAHFAKAD